MNVGRLLANDRSNHALDTAKLDPDAIVRRFVANASKGQRPANLAW